jgi:hypothetical protein
LAFEETNSYKIIYSKINRAYRSWEESYRPPQVIFRELEVKNQPVFGESGFWKTTTVRFQQESKPKEDIIHAFEYDRILLKN